MPTELPNPFNTPFAGRVNASGVLTIPFGPPNNEMWTVSQISIEMPTAPVGATVEIRYGPSFVDAGNSPRRASAGGDPPIFLQPGERMSVVWEGCTPNDYGQILVVYRKAVFY